MLMVAALAQRSCIESVAPKTFPSTGARIAMGRSPQAAARTDQEARVSVAANSRVDSRYLEALGPIRPLVEDDSLTEIMVNGPEMVYVERKGKILLTDIRFDDDAHLLRVIDTIVSVGWPPRRRPHPPL